MGTALALRPHHPAGAAFSRTSPSPPNLCARLSGSARSVALTIPYPVCLGSFGSPRAVRVRRRLGRTARRSAHGTILLASAPASARPRTNPTRPCTHPRCSAVAVGLHQHAVGHHCSSHPRLAVGSQAKVSVPDPRACRITRGTLPRPPRPPRAEVARVGAPIARCAPSASASRCSELRARLRGQRQWGAATVPASGHRFAAGPRRPPAPPPASATRSHPERPCGPPHAAKHRRTAQLGAPGVHGI